MARPGVMAARVAAAAAWLLAATSALLCLLGGWWGCRAATLLGDEGLYFVLGILVYAFLDGGLGAVGVSSAALAASATVFLKQFLALPRPPGAIEVGAVGPGFPSGHTTVAAAFWVAMGLWARSPLLTIGGALLAAAVGYTRIALGAHYSLDVAGGYLVGVFSAATVAGLARSWGPAGAAAVASPAGFMAAVLAWLLAPGYRAAWRLAGIDAGLYAAALWVAASGLEWCLSARLGTAQRLAAAALPLAMLVAAVAAEAAGGPLAGAAGFAAFAAAALAARPVVCLATLRGTLGAVRAAS